MRVALLTLPFLLGLVLSPVARAGEEIPVKVERVRPQREKLSTLRFLTENRDFLRARMDELKQVLLARDHRPVPMDERFLRLSEMMQELASASDSLAVAERDLEQREFLTSVGELAALESELDLLADLLARQGTRLIELERDFLRGQETALIVVVRGFPAETPPHRLLLTDESGDTVRTAFTSEDRLSLSTGGMAQVFHEFVEPREQTWEVGFEGPGWTQRAPVYVSLEPERDRLTFLELDLTRLRPEPETMGLDARAWVHDPSSPPPREQELGER
jgi:hypothetical protein